MLKFRIIFFAKWLSVFCLGRNYYDHSYFLQVYHISATWVLFCICYTVGLRQFCEKTRRAGERADAQDSKRCGQSDGRLVLELTSGEAASGAWLKGGITLYFRDVTM